MNGQRALLVLAAAAALGSCAPKPLALDVIDRGGTLLITTERPLYLLPRPVEPVQSLDIWSGDRWMWRIRAEPKDTFDLPVRYGEVPSGAVELVAPKPLAAGRIYRLEVGGFGPTTINAFQIGPGNKITTSLKEWTLNPDAILQDRRASKRVPQLMRTGMSQTAAERAFAEEQRLGVRY